MSDRRSFIVRMARGVGLAALGIVVIDANSCIAFWGIQCDACYRASIFMLTTEISKKSALDSLNEALSFSIRAFIVNKTTGVNNESDT